MYNPALAHPCASPYKQGVAGRKVLVKYSSPAPPKEKPSVIHTVIADGFFILKTSLLHLCHFCAKICFLWTKNLNKI